MPDLTARPQSANGHSTAARRVTAGAPQEIIKIQLADHGPLRVPYRDLLATWRLQSADVEQGAQIAAALHDVGVAADKALVEVDPDDEIELAIREGHEQESSPVIGIGDALRMLDNAYEEYLAGVASARHELAVVEALYYQEVGRRRVGLDEVDRNRLLERVGRERPVALFEAAIRTPEAEFVLSGSVLARVDVGPAEATLEVTGQGWRMVERFKLGHDVASAEELHRFAALIDVAASRLKENPAGLAERRRAALGELGEAIRAREPVERALRKLVGAASATEALDYTRLTAAATIGSSPRRRFRAVRRARKRVEAVRDGIFAMQTAVAGEGRRVQQESAQAATIRDGLELPAPERALVLPR